MSSKKPFDPFVGPPANPTSLGEGVWVGMTQPTPGALATIVSGPGSQYAHQQAVGIEANRRDLAAARAAGHTVLDDLVIINPEMPSMDPHSAMYCEHANEVPMVCPCEPDCFCRRGSIAHGGPCRTARLSGPPKAVDAVAEIARGAASVSGDGGRSIGALAVAIASAGVMRIMIVDEHAPPVFGVFLGLLVDDHGDTVAIVRPDHYGLMVKAVHPSRVTPVTPEEEAARKP